MGACCVGCCACAVVVAAITFLVYCIIAVSGGRELQHSTCPHAAEVWWTLVIMLICQAANLCVLPCIFGWEQWKMSHDDKYREVMAYPLMGFHFAIIATEAILVFTFGVVAWTGISSECISEVDKASDSMWILFQITTVLWGCSSIIVGCMFCCVMLVVAGVVAPPGGMQQVPAAGGDNGADDEREAFVEHNPSEEPGTI